MAVNNTTIAGRIYLSGTNDFQQRVPDPTVGDIAATAKFLFEPMNGKYLNEFIDSFVNLIGQQRVVSQQWTNPLAVFKGPALTYGQTIQESIPKWIRAHAYNVDEDTLLSVNRPEFAVYYHSVNRKDYHPITIERPDLQMAFRDEYGLNRLVNSILQTPINSDNYDEYLCMINLLAYYEQNWGFYKHELSAAPTDEATGKEFLTALRAYANKLQFPTSLYSPVGSEFGIPTFARPNELVLLIDAETDASVDVNTLASVFQLDKADIKYRKIVVPEFPVAGAVALLTTDAFFVVNDYVYQNTSFYNPQTLATNYYLHHWEVVSASPVVPAILFTTDTGTSVTTITQTVTGVNITAEGGNTHAAGDDVQLTVELTGTITDNDADLTVRPDAVTWTVTASTAASAGEPIDLSYKTYVDRLGVLHIQKDGLEDGNVLNVTGTTAYVNPSGTNTQYAKTLTITIG